jgi:hypothetical protein
MSHSSSPADLQITELFPKTTIPTNNIMTQHNPLLLQYSKKKMGRKNSAPLGMPPEGGELAFGPGY